MFFPTILFDQISLWLLIVAVILILVPNVADLVDRVRKIKKGDLEVEFDKKLDELQQQTKEAEDRVGARSNIDFVGIPEDVKERIQNSLVEPRGALISLAVEIESRLKELAEQHKITNRGYFAPRKTIQELTFRNLISPEIEPVFIDFWEIRNNAVHARGFVPEPSKLFELAELGLRVLRFLYVVPHDG
jgi:hypothetical protein